MSVGVGVWWREFFDEDYPLLYAPVLEPERTEREVAAAASILRLKEGMRLLDLCQLRQARVGDLRPAVLG